MRILHVFKTYKPDNFAGVERVIWQLATDGVAYGLESEVFCLSPNPHPQTVAVDGHLVHRAKQDLYLASTGLSITGFSTFHRLALNADVVHYHFPWPWMDVAHLLTRPAKPSVVTYHSDVVRQKNLDRLYAPLRDAFLGSVDAIVATSPNYANSSPVLQRFAQKTTSIPIGLASPTAPLRHDLERWQSTVGDGFFFFLGALRYYKGLTFLVEAARITGLPVVVAGDGELRDFVERANLPNVCLLGSVDENDKRALLALCRAFVFPSHLRSEAFGVALLEAAFAGRPMISCEIGTGTSFVNLDRETGIVVPPANADELARAMQRLAGDETLCDRYGAAARERATKLFSSDSMIKSYSAMYSSLTARPGR